MGRKRKRDPLREARETLASARKLRELMQEFHDRVALEYPEIASVADDEAFLHYFDLDTIFPTGPDRKGPPPDGAVVTWLIKYAFQIVNAELRGGEALPDQEMYDLDDDEMWALYERREQIEDPRVRRAVDVLNRAGFILPPELREEEEEDEV